MISIIPCLNSFQNTSCFPYIKNIAKLAVVPSILSVHFAKELQAGVNESPSLL